MFYSSIFIKKMAQIDFVTYSSIVFFVYVAFWFYFACCVAAVTNAYRFVNYNLFLNYSLLFPVYVRFVNATKN